MEKPVKTKTLVLSEAVIAEMARKIAEYFDSYCDEIFVINLLSDLPSENSVDAAVEVTPAMIAAGVDSFCGFDLQFTSIETVVSDVFTQMVSTASEASRTPARSNPAAPPADLAER